VSVESESSDCDLDAVIVAAHFKADVSSAGLSSLEIDGAFE